MSGIIQVRLCEYVTNRDIQFTQYGCYLDMICPYDDSHYMPGLAPRLSFITS